MTAHEFLATYSAKSAEYLLAIGYLLLFIPFWKYVQGGRSAEARLAAGAHAPARAAAARAARPAPQPTGWFDLPAGVHLHPGHTWARVESDGAVAVGADDFAHKLVGPAMATLPALGAEVTQGEPAFAIGDGERSVPMLSPVDGKVVAVNAAAGEGRNGSDDPYGAGWLFKVKPRRLAPNLRQLLEENAARRFLESAGEALAMRMSPELGRVLQDGGVPVHGIAREIEGDAWEKLARRFFLT
jgi:glycine cleavage system H protein